MLRIQKNINKLFINHNKLRFNIYNELKESQYLPINELKKKQLGRLNNILNHAFQNVPYYSDLFNKIKIVRNNKIDLTDLGQLNLIPILTKDDIRNARDTIYTRDHKNRKSYLNTSGGSTGTPVYFLQDEYYYEASAANFMLVKSWRDVDNYDSVINLWGAQRDTYKGKKPFDMYLRDFIRNRLILNTAKMDDEIMRKYINLLNKHQPELIIAYVQSIYEIARFAQKNNIIIKKQNAIHTSAGTLFDYMRDTIEKVFHCPVYNHYGSREVSSIASECSEHNGLHILMDHLIVETINQEGKLCQPGEEGDILITVLNNYSMPLIRYQIGDYGILQEEDKCNCGCNYLKINKVIGRSGDSFITKRNKIISPEYLTLTFNFLDGVKQFQLIQKDMDHILIRIVKDDNFNEKLLTKVLEQIEIIMDWDCKVEFEFPVSISTTPTGKFRYTICEINDLKNNRFF